jgi:hypothetical protein
MKRIQLEAWHLISLHTLLLRCLENNIELPDYGDTFFDRCCSGVASTRDSFRIAEKDPSHWDSIQIYRKEREIVGLKEVSYLTGYSDLKRELRAAMVVNAAVMIKETFKKRMRKYVEVKFGKKKVQRIIQACYNILESDVSEVKHMRSMLTPDGAEWSDQWIPWPMNITKNGIVFYVKQLWQFQKAIEDRMEKVPNEKKIRAFLLFPISCSYTASHFTINGTTLAGFFSRLRKRNLRSFLDCIRDGHARYKFVLSYQFLFYPQTIKRRRPPYGTAQGVRRNSFRK